MYGWLSGNGSTVRVQEDGPGQRFEVGYIKPGTAQPPTIQLTVEDTEGTASMLKAVLTLIFSSQLGYCLGFNVQVGVVTILSLIVT